MYDAPATTMALGASSAETPSPEETSTASSEASPEREASAQASATRSDGRGANATPEQEVSASAAAVDRRKKPQSVERGTSKRFLLELNPYSILIGRYSLTGEYLVTNEHAIVATAYAVYKGMDQVTTDGLPPGRFAYGADVMLTAIGGEIGYRYYPFSERARPYLGASVLVGRYAWSGQDRRERCPGLQIRRRWAIDGRLFARVVPHPGAQSSAPLRRWLRVLTD